jgi:hypothetical protein
MGNEEYKEIMDELYKFLRDKINIALGEYLTDKQKEKLGSFDFENNIVVGKETNKLVEYKMSDDKIYVSDEFLTPEYIEKVKEKNPEFDLIDLKNRVNAENPKVLLEELIAFSADLKLTEKDLIKSLFTQEILKMILMNEDMDAKEDAIMTGTIELLAHKLGSQNGFLVSTPKKYERELEAAIGLKDELEDKFEEIVLKGNVLDYLSRIQNSRLLEKINELADDRKIIESTQNLDNVIDSIVNMTNENQEIIDEVNKKEEVKEMMEENKEEIVEIGDTEEVKTEPIVTEVSEVPTNDVVESAPIVEERVQEEVATVNDETVIPPVPEPVVEEPTPTPVVPEPTPVVNEVTSEPAKTNKKALIYTVVVILTIALGVLIGYLLFKFK